MPRELIELTAVRSLTTPVALTPIGVTPTAKTSTGPTRSPDAAATARVTLDRAVAHLRGLQDPAGWWKGELATNVSMDAEDMMLREFLGIATADTREQTARWIRSQQREDGTWATFHGGPGDLSTTIEAWVALRIAGDKPAAEHMHAAQAFVVGAGGVEASRVFTRIWLALFGWWDWKDLPNMPPELILLPDWMPLNVYNWGCWARQTVVPLTVVGTIRPVRPLRFGIDELRTGAPATKPQPLLSLPGAFQRLDRVLNRYSRHPVRSVRTHALRRAAEWIVARQEADGGWGGIQPPWVYSILALHLLGYSLDHPVLKAAIDGLEGFVITEDGPDGLTRRVEACQSPVWDTALAVNALLDAGVPGEDRALRRAGDWLLSEQITAGGDWQVRRPDIPSGGWAFEFANDGYPDTDDSAIVVMGLRRVATNKPNLMSKALDRGIAWTAGMQSKDGGWGAFDADNTRTLALHLPFSDFGALIDPPSADVTAHVVEMLAAEGRAGGQRCKRGVQWLLDHQESDGSWFGRWGANHVYGIGAVLPALTRAGVDTSVPAVRAAVRWLEAHQNADGGWGEDLRSYDDPSTVGQGASTASQTAWAIMALVAAGEVSPALDRGVAYLAQTQRADGTWDEDLFTGTGFPGDFYINYHLYRLVFPVWALGRYLGGGAAG